MSGKAVVRRAGPAQSSSGLVELPLEILEMVAQMLPDAFSLAQMHQGSTGLHSACSRRVAELQKLIDRFARMPAILRSARQPHWPLPLDFSAICDHQEAAEAGLETHLSEDGRVLASTDPPGLLMTIEVRYEGELWHWSGPPSRAIKTLREAGPHARLLSCAFPRVWIKRPEWIDVLNRLNDEAPEEAAIGWTAVRMELYLSLGVRTIKIYDGHSDGGDGETWSWFPGHDVGSLYYKNVTLGRPTNVQMGVFACPSLSDDGEVDLDLVADPDDQSPEERLTVPEVQRYLSLAAAALRA
jgi:hypothetical protein